MTDRERQKHATGKVYPIDWPGWGSDRDVLLDPTSIERPIVQLITGWISYAEQHIQHRGRLVGEDTVQGVAWARIGGHLRTALQGHIGRLNARQLDAVIVENLLAQGFDPGML